MNKTSKKNLYDDVVYDDIKNRIGQLSPSTVANWGKMNVAQMLAHCAEVQEVINGKPLENIPWYIRLFKGFIKKGVLSDKNYPKNLTTLPQYIVVSEKEFTQEKERLQEALQEFKMNKEKSKQVEHQLFGVLSPEEKGWASYKHLNHHLLQFGV